MADTFPLSFSKLQCFRESNPLNNDVQLYPLISLANWAKAHLYWERHGADFGKGMGRLPHYWRRKAGILKQAITGTKTYPLAFICISVLPKDLEPSAQEWKAHSEQMKNHQCLYKKKKITFVNRPMCFTSDSSLEIPYVPFCYSHLCTVFSAAHWPCYSSDSPPHSPHSNPYKTHWFSGTQNVFRISTTDKQTTFRNSRILQCSLVSILEWETL